MNESKKIPESFVKLSCLIFAIAATAFTYKAHMGIGFFLLCLSAVSLLGAVLYRLKMQPKPETILLCALILVLSFCSSLTLDSGLRFLNTVAVLLLADRILIHQFNNDSYWSVPQHIGQLILMFFRTLDNLTAWIYSWQKKQWKNSVKKEAPAATTGGASPDLSEPKSPALVRTIHLSPEEESGHDTVDESLKPERRKKIAPVIIGLCLSLPLVIIVLTALSSADPVFKEVITRIISYKLLADIFENAVPICLMVFFIGLFSCSAVTYFLINPQPPLPEKKGAREPLIAITVFSVLGVIYVLFCAIQMIYLFGHATLPAGYTYAMYARRGFFQLLFVCVVNIILILVSSDMFRKDRILQILATAFSACTLIMNISATYRMMLYISAYSLSYDRLAALFGLGVVYLLLAGLVIRIYKDAFPIFRFAMLITAFALLAFNCIRPARFIAGYNLEHAKSGEVDYRYLSDLGLDAFPVVAEYYEDGQISKSDMHQYLYFLHGNYRVTDIWKQLEREKDDWRSYNSAASEAREWFETYNFFDSKYVK